MELNWREQADGRMVVTPEMARYWLEHHNQWNRDWKPSVVTQYVRDLQSGHWPRTHQGIAFDWNGQLIDGQHRLRAIADTGISVEMMVGTGYDPLNRVVVDTHSKRSTVDAMSLAGRTVRFGVVAPNSAAGLWPRMMYGIAQNKGKETRQELLEFSALYQDAGEWTLMEFGRHPRSRRVQLAPVMAAVARAYYHYTDHYRLAQFVEVLCTGIPRSPEDNTAIHWRNALVNSVRVNSNQSQELYGKTCRAIQNFMRRDELKKFYEPSHEPFPLPARSAAEADIRANRVPSERGQLFDSRSQTPRVAAAPR